MAFPAAGWRASFSFRDAKGQKGKMRFIFGDATPSAVVNDIESMITLLQAISNAHVSWVDQLVPDFTYGAEANYLNVFDKARFTFRNTVGNLSHYEVPSPKSTIFLADQETVDETNTDVEAWVALMQAHVYSSDQDTAPLALVGGLRARRKTIRKFNIFTLDPSLGSTGE